MSTTISYKGSTIATLSNETKTLTTAGTWVEGDISITDASGTAAISVVDTTDSHGGTIREITALDISDTTAVASDVASGKYFYTASGVKTAGTGSGGGSSSYTRTAIAPVQTVTPTSTTSDGNTYYSAQLNVSSGLESGEEYIITYNGTEYFYTCTVLWGNTYLLGELNYFYGTTGLPYPFGILWVNGNTCRMACGDSTAVTVKIEKLEFVAAPSATAHTIYFEFSDSTDTTITAYYDDSFISSAITATTPTTYGSKTIELARLDNVTWYTRPTETWEIIFNNVTAMYVDGNSRYFWLTGLANVTIPLDSVWRITLDDTIYDNMVPKTIYITNVGSTTALGNPKFSEGSDDGSDVPFCFYNYNYQAWAGDTELPAGDYSLKIERLVTS